MKYILHRGMDTEIVECDSVSVVLDDGAEIEMHFRTTDRELSLSAGRGSLVIEPRASNVVRVSAKR